MGKAKRKAQLARERRLEQRQKHTELVMSPKFTEEWIKDPRPLCPLCKHPSDTVAVRIDPYMRELHEVEEEMESCLGCWDERRLEV